MIDNAIKVLNYMNLIYHDDGGIIRIKQMCFDIRNNNTSGHGKNCCDS